MSFKRKLKKKKKKSKTDFYFWVTIEHLMLQIDTFDSSPLSPTATSFFLSQFLSFASYIYIYTWVLLYLGWNKVVHDSKFFFPNQSLLLILSSMLPCTILAPSCLLFNTYIHMRLHEFLGWKNKDTHSWFWVLFTI